MVVCDGRMPAKLKWKVHYKPVIRPAMMCRADIYSGLKRSDEKSEYGKIDEYDIILRWMCGVTRNDKITNEHMRETTRVAHSSKKITERRLNWNGHAMRKVKNTY